MDANNRQLLVLRYLIHTVGLVTLIVGGCAYHFIVSAALTHQQRRNADEAAHLEERLQKAGEVRRQQADLTQRLADLERRAEEIRGKIPDQPKESDFLEQISTAAKAHGLVIENYTRGGVTTTATHSLLEIRMTGAGDFQSICGFFEEMANLSRVATVQRMNLAIPNDSDIYPLDITLTLYFGARAPQGGNNG
jgi:Tfp pilus assembly protein PilO